MAETRTVRVRIDGRVQGVWYRRWAQDRASVLGLAGWVRNRRDGSVEALFSGPAVAVEEMLALCRSGPPGARVDAVTQHEADPPGPGGFEVRPTE